MDFVPANIIKTPDFGSMAQNAMQQKRQEQKEMNSWIDSNEKKEGAYLEGDKPLVQEAWNKYQSQLDMAIESDSPEAKRKADEAYGEYAQVAGMAIANADQYRTQVAAYKADPSKYSIAGQEFLSLTDNFRRSKRTLDDLTLAVQEPFVLPQSMKYDLANPVDQANKMLKLSSAKVKDFYNDSGDLNTSSARAHAESMAEAFINANESSVEKALAWGGVRNGFAGGEDEMINSMEELEFLRNQPEEKKQEFIQSYKKELVDNFMRNLPSDFSSLSSSKSGSGKEYLRLEDYQVEMEGPTSTEDASPLVLDFKAFAKPFTGSMKNVVGFAFDNDGELVVEETYEVEERNQRGQKETVTKTRTRGAEPNEIARIKNALKKDYGISLDGNSVSSQEETTEATEGKDSLGIL